MLSDGDRSALLKTALSTLNSINDLDPTGDQWRECTVADTLCRIVGVPIWDTFGINHIPTLDDAKRVIEVALANLSQKGTKYTEQENNGLVQPSTDTLTHWIREGVSEAACPERCTVEPDGYCPHGEPSWLLVKGLI